MSRTRWTIGHGHPSLATLGLIGVLVLAACGGSSSPAPSDDGDGTPAPGASIGPGETQGPGESQGPGDTIAPGDGSGAFSAATTTLDALDSYAFSVELSQSSGEGDTLTTSHSRYSGVVVNRPTEANSLQIAELDADGNVTSGTEFVVIGAEAWVRDVGGTEWAPLPAAQVTPMFAAFRPEQMFGTYFAGFGGNFTTVGTETKNGIDTTHYRGDEEIGALLGSIAGVNGQWTSDAWIANDGDYLVHSEAGVAASAGTETGSFLIVVDITDPNSAGPIEPPA